MERIYGSDVSDKYSKEETQMNKLAHAAGRKVFSGVIDVALGQVKKNPEQAFLNIVDTAQKYIG